MKPRVILRSLDDVGRVAQRLAEAWHSQGGKPLEVSLKRYSPKRSTDQNARLWWLHGLTAQRLNQVLADELAETQNPVIAAAMRSPWDAETVHKNIFKPQFCGGKSSTRLSKMDMVDAQTAYEAWMVEIGVVFPEQEYA